MDDWIVTPLLYRDLRFGGIGHDARNGTSLHTYSGYENKVKKSLETRIESLWVLKISVFAIEIPTETVTEIKEGGRRVESDKEGASWICAGPHGT